MKHFFPVKLNKMVGVYTVPAFYFRLLFNKDHTILARKNVWEKSMDRVSGVIEEQLSSQ